MLTLDALHRRARLGARAVALVAGAGESLRAGAAVASPSEAAGFAEAEGFAAPAAVHGAADTILPALLRRVRAPARARPDSPRGHEARPAGGSVGERESSSGASFDAIVATPREAQAIARGAGWRPLPVDVVLVGRRVLAFAPTGLAAGKERAAATALACRALARLGVEAHVGVLGDETIEAGDEAVRELRALGLLAKNYGPIVDHAFSEADVLAFPHGGATTALVRALQAVEAAHHIATLLAIEPVPLLETGAATDVVEAIALASALVKPPAAD
ncbi:MAG TPA: hypothetical protein VM889_06420 [Candidatus Thermoplasmatota archaeon]|nr:hypothetical protein [Candidatus Thermoplasmatota archaeon]